RGGGVMPGRGLGAVGGGWMVAGGGPAGRGAGGRGGPGDAGHLGGEGGRTATQADWVAGQRAAQRTGSDGGGGGAVVNLIVSRDAARDHGFGDVKGTAQRTGQATAVRAELLAGAGHGDL